MRFSLIYAEWRKKEGMREGGRDEGGEKEERWIGEIGFGCERRGVTEDAK